jgi:hypothetical protein
VGQAVQILKPANHRFPRQVSGQIQMRYAMEGGRVREMYEASLKKQSRIDREVPEVREIIECVEDYVKSVESITSPTYSEVDQTGAVAEKRCNCAGWDRYADVQGKDRL